MSGEFLDQIFVATKRWILSFLTSAPDWVQQLASSLLNIVVLVSVFAALFALISVLERKILGRIQNRYAVLI